MLSRKTGTPRIFPGAIPNEGIGDHRKYNEYLFKNQGPTKVWITSLILCFAICVTIVSITVWIVSIMREKSTNNSNTPLEMQSPMKFNDHYVESDYTNSNDFLEYKNTNNAVDNALHIEDKKEEPPPVEETHQRDMQLQKMNESLIEHIKNETFKGINAALESIDLKKIVFHAVGSLTSAAVDNLRFSDKSANLEKALKSTEDPPRKTNKADEMASLASLHAFVVTGTTDFDRKFNDSTQISSPDDVMAQATTKLGDLLNKGYDLNKKKDEAVVQATAKLDDLFNKGYDLKRKQEDLKDLVQGNPEKTWVPKVDKKKDKNPYSSYFNIFGSEFKNTDESYDNQDDYFYSDSDAQAFYYDYERITWAGYILEKIQELHDWITTDFEADKEISKVEENAPLPQILKALNYTIIKGDISILLLKLRDIYYAENNTDFDPERSRQMLTNTTSVVSFGLLAVDVIVLRNMQIMAWEDRQINEVEMFKDPEVFALNAIFMDPNRVKNIYDEIHSDKGRAERHKEELVQKNYPKSRKSLPINKEDLGLDNQPTFFEDFVKFITSTFRAVIHLGHAFRNARSQIQNERIRSLLMFPINGGIDKNSESAVPSDALELDCLWTLYCKNLDKATRLGGPYGFLAKMNSVGLRMLMGVLPIDKILETLIDEALTESRTLNCDKLFPKCDGKNASKIVLDEILRSTSDKEKNR